MNTIFDSHSNYFLFPFGRSKGSLRSRRKTGEKEGGSGDERLMSRLISSLLKRLIFEILHCEKQKLC